MTGNKKVVKSTITKTNKMEGKTMIKFNKEMIKEAHRLTKEIQATYKEVDYMTQFGLVMQMLIEDAQKKEIIYNSFNDWFENDYLKNDNYYGYILYNSNIIDKNGKLSYTDIESQKMDAAVGMNYQILQGSEDDIKQDVLIKMYDYFQKYQELPYIWRGSTYAQACRNILKFYRKQNKRSVPSDEYVFQKLEIHSHYDDVNHLIMDIEGIATDKQYEIACYIRDGYNDTDIEGITGISRQYINRLRRQLQQRITDSGLLEVYSY